MNMDEQKLTYEQFKEDILQWKNTHREEYNRFSRLMTNGDERQYLAICKAIFRQLPGIRREWELSWNDDSTDGLANINMQFAENAVPGQIVDLYRKQREENNPLPDNVPPVTFWGRIKSFFSGKSSKPMVSMIEKQMKNPKADNADRLGCSLVIKQIIKVSIKNGFRSQEEWDKHFAMSDAIEKGCIGKWALQSVCKEDATRSIPEHSKKQTTAYTTTSIPESSVTSGRLKAKDLPLSSYIDCQNKDAVIEVLRKFLISQHTANGQALSYYALTQLELLTVKSDKEFSIGVIKEFGDIPTLKSESAIRQAISQLRREQYINVNQKIHSGRLIDSDEYVPVLRRLKNEIIGLY